MSSTLERIRSLIALTSRERRLLALAWWRFLVVQLALRLVPVTRLVPVGPISVAPACSLSAHRIGWLVTVAGRYAPGQTTCLTQALVLVWMLRREGIEATLRIGVARQAGGLKAHAWLEHDGRAIFGMPEREAYEPLLPTAPGAPAP